MSIVLGVDHELYACIDIRWYSRLLRFNILVDLLGKDIEICGICGLILLSQGMKLIGEPFDGFVTHCIGFELNSFFQKGFSFKVLKDLCF